MTKKKDTPEVESIATEPYENQISAEEVLAQKEAKKASTKKESASKPENINKVTAQTVTTIGPVKKAERKEYGYDQEDAILSISGKLRVTTEKSEREKALLDIRASQEGLILTGTVSSVEMSSKMGPVANIMYRGYKIIIPSKLFKHFPKYDDTMGYQSEQHMQLVIMRKHLMAEVDFMVYPNSQSVDEVEQIAIASRIAAMNQKKKAYWIDKDKRGKTIITNGLTVEARVINVPSSCAVVEIWGVEFKIPTNELSWRVLRDASTAFEPGQIILVKIDNIQIDEKGVVSAYVSHRLTQENPQERAIEHLSEASMCIGKVTAVTKFGIFVTLEQGAEVRCSMPIHTRMPIVGDKVRVKIVAVDQFKLRVDGDIQAVFG